MMREKSEATNVGFFLSENNSIFFKKSLDKRKKFCYNNRVGGGLGWLRKSCGKPVDKSPSGLLKDPLYV
tara:strand:- start:69 stop:275 length:207 start_codon:yes stop_codon:yes gene_type:complete